MSEIIDEIAEVVGKTATMQLLQVFGGCRLYFGHKKSCDDLAAVVGDKAATALSDYFCGERIDLPLAREELVTWLAGQGKSVDEIARLLRIRSRWVASHIRAQKSRARAALFFDSRG
ncbi:MAG: hypothetical protein AAF442_05345 [Pseudomonadota bacterium]